MIMTDNQMRNPHLDGTPFYWKGGAVAVLCLHGFTATTVEVRDMAAFLFNKGYTVRAPLLPGHGKSPEEMNQTGWRDWFGKAESSLKELQRDYQKVFVLGESMGALLTLRLAALYPSLQGILLFAPALKINNLWLSKYLWPFKPMMKKKPPMDQLPQQSYTSFPLKAAASLYAFQAIVRQELPQIHIPVRIFQGPRDDTINPIGAVLINENIGSLDKELIIMEESGHLILLDKQKEIVEEMTLAFIEKFANLSP